MTAEHEHLRTLLIAAALEFRSGRRSTALPLVELANRNGIEVWTQGTPSRSEHVAQISLGSPVSIVLYRTEIQPGSRRLAPEDEVRLTGRERFSIAHELGHWVLFSRGGHVPLAQSGDDRARRAYLDDEALCDDFANRLLIPDWLVDGWLDPIPPGVGISPAQLRRMAASARVSAEVVANAAVRRRSGLGFLKVSKVREPPAAMSGATPVFLVEFSVAARGVRVPRRKDYIRDSDVGALILKKQAGTAYLADCKLGRGRGQSLTLAWESKPGRPLEEPHGSNPTRTWISLAQPRRDQLSFL